MRRLVTTRGTAEAVLPPETTGDLRSNPITAAMLDSDFCLTRSCLDTYGRTAAQWGGAIAGGAACSVWGIPAAPCAALGSWLGRLAYKGLGKLLGPVIRTFRRAKGESLEQFYAAHLELPFLENQTRAQLVDAAPARIVAALAYEAERRSLLDRARMMGMSPAEASRRLDMAGVPSLVTAAGLAGWLGTTERWNQWGALGLHTFEGWSPSHADGMAQAVARLLYRHDPPTGLDLYNTVLFLNFPSGPPSPPGQVDLGLLGADPSLPDLARHAQIALRDAAPAFLSEARGGGLNLTFEVPGGRDAGWLEAVDPRVFAREKGSGAAVAIALLLGAGTLALVATKW